MNKVEKIKAEIERLKQQFMSQADDFHSLGMEEKENHCAILASNMAALIRYIDSLSDTEKDFGIKESVIPFGASDSELMEVTYFIPQGYHAVIDGDKVIIKKGEEPVSNDLEEACDEYYNETWDEHGGKAMVVDGCHDIWFPSQATDDFFKAGAQWQKENLWKDAQGDDLPEVDREVIALVEENEHYKVVFAHRPPEYWDGKNILTGEVTRYEPKRYDKGGWNQPNVVYWLDVELPKEEE